MQGFIVAVRTDDRVQVWSDKHAIPENVPWRPVSLITLLGDPNVFPEPAAAPPALEAGVSPPPAAAEAESHPARCTERLLTDQRHRAERAYKQAQRTATRRGQDDNRGCERGGGKKEKTRASGPELWPPRRRDQQAML